MKYLARTIFLVFFSTVSIHAQLDDDFVFEDYVYVDYIKTVQFKGVATQTSNFPVIQLNKGRLYFSFDDLSPDAVEYTYRVIHCDKNWNPSDLDPIDYIEGFDFAEIKNFEFSQNTIVDYIHYNLTLPNRDYRWLISGNYLLVIYEGDESDGYPVITRRFMVAEQSADVGIEKKNPIRVDKVNTHHEFDYFVNYRDMDITDPRQEVSTVVLQNYRWGSAITDLKPNYVSRDIMNFNYNDRITFPALKEFRNFDIRNLQFASQWIHSIDLHRDGTDVVLKLSEPRTYDHYHTRPDINGSFFIANDDNDGFIDRRADLTADYADVYFTLQMEPLPPGLDVYAIGGFSGWNPMPEYQLKYDNNINSYVGNALFKQGRYDYLYAIVDDATIDIEALEGNSYETGNDYTVLVYLSAFTGRYDRLIAVKTFEINNN